jgi:hypothetical protein
MRRNRLRSIVAALALLSLPMLGCEVASLSVQLPGYGNGAVDGLWLWKQVGGQWTRVCRIDFEDRRLTEKGEMLWYVQNCINGKVRRGVLFASPVERPAGDAIAIDLIYLRYESSGQYRATAFNQFGESALSSTSVPL